MDWKSVLVGSIVFASLGMASHAAALGAILTGESHPTTSALPLMGIKSVFTGSAYGAGINAALSPAIPTNNPLLLAAPAGIGNLVPIVQGTPIVRNNGVEIAPVKNELITAAKGIEAARTSGEPTDVDNGLNGLFGENAKASDEATPPAEAEGPSPKAISIPEFKLEFETDLHVSKEHVGPLTKALDKRMKERIIKQGLRRDFFNRERLTEGSKFLVFYSAPNKKKDTISYAVLTFDKDGRPSSRYFYAFGLDLNTKTGRVTADFGPRRRQGWPEGTIFGYPKLELAVNKFNGTQGVRTEHEEALKAVLTGQKIWDITREAAQRYVDGGLDKLREKNADKLWVFSAHEYDDGEIVYALRFLGNGMSIGEGFYLYLKDGKLTLSAGRSE